MTRDTIVGISKAPTDPEEKKKWVKGMLRIQIAMWLSDGATCAHCGHKYDSVEDFQRCTPYQGYGPVPTFVCAGCWPEYQKAAKQQEDA